MSAGSAGGPDPDDVRRMFDRLAPIYDRWTRRFSLHLDAGWRRRAVDLLDLGPADLVLDVGVGTGELAREVGTRLQGGRVVGVDPSRGMLLEGRDRGGRRARPDLIQASGLALPHPDGCFDAAASAFVLRNVPDLDGLFRELHRVVRPGGRVMLLDAYQPRGPVLGPLFDVAFHHVMPWVGRVVAREPEAYRYLSESVRRQEPPEVVAGRLRSAGFVDVEVRRLSGGMVAVQLARRP